MNLDDVHSEPESENMLTTYYLLLPTSTYCYSLLLTHLLTYGLHRAARRLKKKNVLHRAARRLKRKRWAASSRSTR